MRRDELIKYIQKKIYKQKRKIDIDSPDYRNNLSIEEIGIVKGQIAAYENVLKLLD